MDTKSLLIDELKSLKDAMISINEAALGIVFIVDQEKRLKGVLSDGDIRRALLSGKTLSTPIKEIVNRNPLKVSESLDEGELNQILSDENIRQKIPRLGPLVIPEVDGSGKIINIILLERDGFVRMNESHKFSSRLSKVLVIGGAGYIGSNLVRDLLGKNYKVKVMDNLTYTDEGIKDIINHPLVEFIKGDVLNISDVVSAAEDVDAVIHLAAMVGDPSSQIKPKETVEVNYFATKNLVEVCKYLGIPRFVFASTCSVYGFNETMVRESSKLNPLSLYAETKVQSEQAILQNKNSLFKPTVLRLSTVYGPSSRMRFDLVVNLLTAKAIFDHEISVYGEGRQMRPFIDVRDVSKAIVMVLEAPLEKVGGEVFNVGDDSQNYSIKNVAEIIAKSVPGSKMVFIKEKEDNRSYFASFSKIAENLGFKAEHNIEDAVKAIKEMADNGIIKDYRDSKYSNYKTLKESSIKL